MRAQCRQLPHPPSVAGQGGMATNGWWGNERTELLLLGIKSRVIKSRVHVHSTSINASYRTRLQQARKLQRK
jgi:hypothetical protein